jgi:hypothetical protein
MDCHHRSKFDPPCRLKFDPPILFWLVVNLLFLQILTINHLLKCKYWSQLWKSKYYTNRERVLELLPGS